jgi:hypothetical protein
MSEPNEGLANQLYAHAVAMHESIVAGRGATGWNDKQVLADIAAYRVEIEAEAKREAHTTCCPGCNHCMETALDVQELYSGEYNRGKREGFRDALEKAAGLVDDHGWHRLSAKIRALLPSGEPQGGQGEIKAPLLPLPLGHEFVRQMGSGFADPGSRMRWACVARVKHGDIGCTRDCGRPREEH